MKSDLPEFELFFQGAFVGAVKGCFEHQGTWFGEFYQRPDANVALPEEVNEFIRFCKEFNNRTETGHGTEFSRFESVISSGKWRLRRAEGAMIEIEDAPNFIGEQEISWTYVVKSQSAS